MKAANLYVLFNCVDICGLLTQYDSLLESQRVPERSRNKKRVDEFPNWLHEKVRNDVNYSEIVRNLAHGPDARVKTYKGYTCNGFQFHTEKSSRNMITVNSGGFVKRGA